MAITSNFANAATVTRASKAWDPLWDFTSGGTVGTLTEYASGVARTGANGLLVEEASTNQIRNPRFEGGTSGVLGSGGALPTNFIGNNTTGLEVAYGTENGRDYMDLIAAAWTPPGNVTLGFDALTQIAAVQNETWTAALDCKLVSGDFSNVNKINLSVWERNAGSSLIQVNDGVDIQGTIDATARRFFLTDTLGEATTAYTQFYFELEWTSGAWTFRLRIYAPQFEEKAYPTSPILPTVASPAASTRAADAITVSLGAWFDAAAMTHFMEYTLPHNSKAASTLYAFSIGDGGGTDVIAIGGYTAGSTARAFVVTSGAAVVNFSNTNPGDGATIKQAAAFAADDFALSVNGAAQQTDSSCAVPTGHTTMYIGSYPNGGGRVNVMYVKDLRHWPRRLSNTELEALVGN